ncbi:MAG TPA: sugar nucleotide-binding protein [Solirubrobacteraceae bacterium]
MLILVTGASGLLGSNLTAAAVQQSWSVLGTWHEDPVEIPGASTIALDMSDRAACVAVATSFEPEVIVHAATEGAPGPFEYEPQLGRVGRIAAENTLAAARTVRARYVLVSCDWVFSGLRAAGERWVEDDFPEPVNAYGRAKLVAEELVREANVGWLITRVADVYGVNMAKPADQSFARHVWERSGSALRLVGRLREGHSLPAPADVHRSPTYAWDYAQRVCELVAMRREGVLHTAGPDAMHRREYLRLLARAFACDPELVREGSLAAYLEACGEDQRLPLPPNTALDDERARAALGHQAVDVEAGLGQMGEQLRRVLDQA